MASRIGRHLSTEEVLALIAPEEECEVDDPNEVLEEGSDEEFDELDEIENGTIISSMKHEYHYCIL